MTLGITNLEQLDELVTDYMEFDEFVIDLETLGATKEIRLDPLRNEVFWISMGGPGRADVIPCGHPIGERIQYEIEDEFHRINPRTGKHEEHRLNETTGRLRWERIPEPFTDPPKQLWVSDVYEMLRPLLFSDRRKIGQNVKFDLETSAKYYGGAIPPPPYGDTLIAAKLINENFLAYDLGSLIKRSFSFEYDKSKGKELETHPYSEAYQYSFYDARFTWLQWQDQKKQLEKEGVRPVFDIEMELLSAIMDMELAGIAIDTDRLEELGVEYSKEMARIQVVLDKKAGWEINLNADRQVGKFIYDVLGHTCKLRTPSGQRSVSRDIIEPIAKKDPVVRAVLEHSKLSKLHSSFVVGLGNKVNGGRVRSEFDQTGARGGRMSSKQPNLQQIPSRSEEGRKLREIFVSDPKKILVVADLSQIELRILAHYTQDRALLKAYRQGLDLHALTAKAAFGETFTPVDRTYAKNFNFGSLYGAGAKTLVRKYGIPSVKLAQQIQTAFDRNYPRVKPWKLEVLDEARSRYRRGKTAPYILTPLGRKRRLPELYYMDRTVRSGAERQAISSLIQGTAADLFKVAMLRCMDLLQQVSWEGHMLMVVHDEIVLEIPEKFADEGLHLIKTAMENVINPFTEQPFLTVPVIAEAKIGHRWSEAH